MENELFGIGQAVKEMRNANRVCRSGWNGKGMWLELSAYGEKSMYKDRPLQEHILMATAQGTYVPWLASQTDILARDWQLVTQ